MAENLPTDEELVERLVRAAEATREAQRARPPRSPEEQVRAVLALLGPERVAELMWEMLGPEGLARLETEAGEGEERVDGRATQG